MYNELRGLYAQCLSEAFSALCGAEPAAAERRSMADVGFEAKDFLALIEIPKSIDHGHLAYPAFSLAKILRQAPPAIAQRLASFIERAPTFSQLGAERVSVAGGYINVLIQPRAAQNFLFKDLREKSDFIGFSEFGRGRTVVIDYASPNVAKPMHVGHLRASVIGQSIRNLALTQGYRAIGLNHLGDWGVQFGKLAWAYKEWGSEYDFEKDAFQSLFKLYVRFHDEAEKRPELEDVGSAMFRRMEEGDSELTLLWQRFVEVSLIECQRLWEILGVRHDLVRGESFYNDRLKGVEDLLEKKGLLKESDGAMVVDVGEEIPPCLIRKSDGASLYATRDLASAIYRVDELKADLCLYVVGAEQSLHFRQVFEVLRRAGFAWADRCHHIAFGLYRFKDLGKFSSRRGRVVFLEDVIRGAIDRVRELLTERNPDWPETQRERVANQVGVGAVIFNDLSFDRVKDVEFDWDRVLNFEGDSGPYVQYMYVRCVSLLKKYGKVPVAGSSTHVLAAKEEQELIRLLLSLDEVLSKAFNSYKPSLVAQYLLEVCAVFARFYRECRILGEAEPVEAARMELVLATKDVLAVALRMLNMPLPEVM